MLIKSFLSHPFVKVTELKNKGNEALNQNNFPEAIAAYTEAIGLDGQNHVLYSNRSAAYAKASQFELALQDAEKTIELNPSWPKGYSRKGAALTGLGRFKEGHDAFEEGLKYDPTNAALMQGKQENKMAHIQSLMKDGNMDFEELLNQAQRHQQYQPPPQQPKQEQKEPQKPAEPMYEDLSEEDQKKFDAKKAKEAGNAAYKKKDFENALLHYNQALQFDPTDITFHNNIAAVYFEQKEFDKCIKECEKAIEVGRENRADFKLIAKAFSRIGNVHRKQNNWTQAKVFYEKAMSEHRTPEVKTLLSEVEKKIKDEELKAYIDPSKAEEQKEKGNELFKKGDYSGAVKHYSEAIKRNPDDPKLYSNRAACYTKLAAFDLGLKDCETCIKLDSKFIKGYIRKGKILQVSLEISFFGKYFLSRMFFCRHSKIIFSSGNATTIKSLSCLSESARNRL